MNEDMYDDLKLPKMFGPNLSIFSFLAYRFRVLYKSTSEEKSILPEKKTI